MERIRFIYCATNKANGKKYVGKWSGSMEALLMRHKSSAKSGKLVFAKAIRKYGWDSFEWDVLFSGRVNVEEVSKREVQFIEELGTYRDGYNMTPGGEGGNTKSKGWTHSKRTREKISEAKKGKSWDEVFGVERAAEMKRNHARIAASRKHSESTKKKLSANATGRKFTEDHKANISKAAKKRLVDADKIKKMQDAAAKSNLGRVPSAEAKSNMSKAQRRRFESQSSRVAVGASRKGKTWEEIYGFEKAQELREAKRLSMLGSKRASA